MFYNTIKLRGQELADAQTAVEKQDVRVLRVFANNPGVAMTPIEVHQRLTGKPMLLTSVRRALHTLTQKGYLIKTTEREIGKYGAPNYKWILSSKSIN